MLVLLVIALLAPSQVFALEGCSSGDTKFMCENLNVCWTALGFASRDDLKYLCEIQGILCSFTSDNVDSSSYSNNMLYPSLHILLIYNYLIYVTSAGFTYDDDSGSGSQDDSFVVITTPPRNLTVAEGTAAAFRCSADNALRIVIIKNNEVWVWVV